MYLQLLESSLFKEPWAAMFRKLSSQAAPVEVIAAINIANLATYLHQYNIQYKPNAIQTLKIREWNCKITCHEDGSIPLWSSSIGQHNCRGGQHHF